MHSPLHRTHRPSCMGNCHGVCNGMTTLPETEEKLSAHLGDRFSFPQWKAVFDEVFQCEDDVCAATAAIETLKKSHLTIRPPRTPSTQPSTRLLLPELDRVEKELIQAVDNLHGLKHIRGTHPTLDDLLNPAVEMEVGDSPFWYPGGDNDIITEVKRNMKNNLESQPKLDGDDEDDSEPEPESQMPPQQALTLCAQFNTLCLQYADADHLDLSTMQHQLQCISAHLRMESFKTCGQVTLNHYIIHSASDNTQSESY
ncbi:hypothetical protein J3R82DRAFT_9568 [Butyriboletus roseoflavus]|nr:hypothetical protein J3R82DRAFT_9568 [Butyriboletus roseoflavus]